MENGATAILNLIQKKRDAAQAALNRESERRHEIPDEDEQALDEYYDQVSILETRFEVLDQLLEDAIDLNFKRLGFN